jgi:para-aminobenzoate synthetase component 1
MQFTLSAISPSLLLSITHFFADWQGTCLLYSGGNIDSAQCSFLGLFPFESVTIYGHQLSYQKGKQGYNIKVQDPWNGLQNHFFAQLAQDPHSMAFGWFGYGMGAFADLNKALPYRASSTPDAYWQRCAIILNQHMQQADIQIDLSAIEHLSEESGEWVKRLSTLKGWQDFIKMLVWRHPTYESNSSLQPFLNSLQRKGSYINKVQQAQELIRAGEVYQVNLSQNFEFQSQRHPFSLFHQICELNPAPFSAYFRHEQFSIISTSPERFLCKRGQELETRPIKGTMPRGKTAEEDQLLKEHLLSSAKERAELLMITDLMRNDLGKISKAGSVQTLEIWRCEAYANVFHLLSIIRSQVKPEWKPLDIVRACFPGGSVTGCPKLRAMEVIDELEGYPRGIYTGSIGYFTGHGHFDLNIAIRTLIAEKNYFSLHLGSGIVIDSDPYQEYEETLCKGASIFHILQTREINATSPYLRSVKK